MILNAYGKFNSKLTESYSEAAFPSSDNSEILGSSTLVHKNQFIRRNDPKAQEYPNISFAAIRAATTDFSDSNKLGEGGFGPVYKVITLLLIHIKPIHCRKTKRICLLSA